MRYLSFAFYLLSMSMLMACASSVSRVDDAKSTARGSLPAAPNTWQSVSEQVGDVSVGWVDAIGDETLNKLVQEAQDNNRNLQAAAANVDRSRALARQAGAALTPQVNLGGGTTGSGNFEGNSGNNFGVSVQASWELDIWGRIRSGSEAAAQSFEAAKADYVYSQHSLAAAVANAYFLSIDAQRQTALAKETLDVLTEIQRIAQVQFDNGVASQQDLSLIRSDTARAADTFASAQGGQRDAIRALELLLGRYPSAELALRTSLPAVPPKPPTGIPSELLERRPDLIAAERRIAAAFNNVDQAKAAKLPSLSLTGSVGGSSGALSNLLDPANLAWQAASSLLVPLVDGGARDAQVELTNADQRAAVAQYAQAALGAFNDVESSLDQGVVLRQREAALATSLIEANKALKIAELRYEEGETDLLDVLSIQQRVFGAEANKLSIERALLDQFVALSLALGGDWR